MTTPRISVRNSVESDWDRVRDLRFELLADTPIPRYPDTPMAHCETLEMRKPL